MWRRKGETPEQHLSQIEHWLAHLFNGQEKIMADLTALKAAVAQLATDAATDSAAIIAALGAETPQADIDALTAAVTAADGQINAAAAAVPAAPAPVSTSGTSSPGAGYAPNS